MATETLASLGHASNANGYSKQKPPTDRVIKRSRTGCLTCRKRKKKCPEEWENGSCTRCLQGGFHCVKADPKPKKYHTGPKKDAFAPKGTYTMRPTYPTSISGPDYSMPRGAGSPSDMPLQLASCSTVQDLDDLMAQTTSTYSTTNLDESGLDLFLSPDFQAILSNGSVSENLSELPSLPPISPNTRSEIDALLNAYFYDYVLPSWASIYPPLIARNMIARSRDISELNSLNRLCAQACAACYIAAYRERGGNGKYYYNEYHKNIALGKLADAPINAPLYFFRALEELESAQYDQSMTVEGCLWSTGDLHIAAMAYFDSSVVLRVKASADRIISATFGPHPLIDLATLQGVPTMCLKWYCMDALSRSVVNRQKLSLSYTCSNYNTQGFVWDASQENQNYNDGSHGLYFGLSNNLFVIMADAVNLCSEAHQMASFSTLPPHLVTRAHAVLVQLEKWRPDVTIYDPPLAQRGTVDLAPEINCESELWRQVSMLQVRRLVLRTSPFEPVMKAIVGRALNLIRALIPLMTKRRRKSKTVVDHWALFQCQPVFLVGSILVDEDDRDLIRRYMDFAGPEQVRFDQLAVLEATWKKTDEMGFAVDWFLVANENGMSMAFS